MTAKFALLYADIESCFWCCWLGVGNANHSSL